MGNQGTVLSEDGIWRDAGDLSATVAPATHFEKALPSANTEFGALILIGLTTGWDEMARRTGTSSTEMPLASCSSTSFFSEIESRNSIIFTFRLAHRSCVMQRPVSSPMQFSLPAQPVASMGSSTATKMLGAGVGL